MSYPRALVAATAALGLLAAPALAADPPTTTPPAQGKPATPPGKPADPGKPATPPAAAPDSPYTLPKGKAYGVRCKGQSKKKVPGQKRTPFANCVRAMAQLDEGTTTSATNACKALSKKKPKAKRGAKAKQSPYAACVSAGKKLLREKKAATS